MLITGASGFVGKYVYDFFKSEFKITTVGLAPTDNYICDLSVQVPVFQDDYENVIHLAGLAHKVPKSESEKQAFFDVNCNGLTNLLTALNNQGRIPRRFVLFSSVAVYGLDYGHLINEMAQHNATDAYGKSKSMAENILIDWGKINKVAITILRPPLIVGKDAPGNLGDMVNAIKRGLYFNVKNGKARRSMVLADDIPPFIQLVWNKGGIYHLTDGHNPSFKELSLAITSKLGKRSVINLPYFLVYFVALAFDLLSFLVRVKMPLSVLKLRKLTQSYTFDDSLARSMGWESTSVISVTQRWVC